ncbi:hypothetical protein HMPREF1624_01194 [Sporothrix schenckii ATCC 58251]|uniref:Amidase domain-containing protein n=1 Tax=Sporothrix schenckii (strain ATCC 58251 / de Perez 2211183) TaxID=1391915 RepID=U7Q828_SPOS1|nr:hypothetical protein HMPREF1624_01194 [Sporothrix schenckii ATCC 58251]
MSSTVAPSGLDKATFQALVASFGFQMTPQDEADYYTLVKAMEDEVREVEALPAYVDPRLAPSVATPVADRTYAVPDKADNPLNAWSHRFTLKDAAAVSTGILAGRTVALKDTVAVAGIPLTLGTHPYQLTNSPNEPFPIPSIDAPVVTRLVESGGVVVGTSTCENFCMSGLSDTSASGPVDNPWLVGHAAGGSSSGSGVLTAIPAVEKWRKTRGLPVVDNGPGVDLAIGGDQGGSIRLPAAYSGVYGLKPTRGLVPYTGIASLHPLCDHAGPMASSVADVALLLSAIAGHDGLDPRATPETPTRKSAPAYHELLKAAIAAKESCGAWTPTTAGTGLRVGLLKEGLALPKLDPNVAAIVRAAAAKFESLGATVVDVSVPLHSKGGAIWTAAMRGVMSDVLLAGKAPDLLAYTTTDVAAPPLTQDWYEKMTAASPMVVTAALGSAYLGDTKRFPHSYRSKAVSHVVQLQAAYDAVLNSDVDVLLLPVTPSVAPPHIITAAGRPPGTSLLEQYQANLGVSDNTSPFNITGHPALAMPGGWAPAPSMDGAESPGKLPVGIQLVGKHHDELGVLLAASIWEVGGLGLDEE